MVVIGKTLLYSVKTGCFRDNGFIRAKWLYLGKSRCVRTKVNEFGKSV